MVALERNGNILSETVAWRVRYSIIKYLEIYGIETSESSFIDVDRFLVDHHLEAVEVSVVRTASA